MGIMNTMEYLGRSLASFGIIEDLDDCSSGTETYVESRKERRSSKPKQSVVNVPVSPAKDRSRHSKTKERERERREERKNREMRERREKIDTNVVELKTETEKTRQKDDGGRTDTLNSTRKSRSGLSETTKTPEKEEEERRRAELLRQENEALRLRLERAERDKSTYRRTAKHYKERREEVERERTRVEERCKDLETVVTNMRDSYEHEIEDLIKFTQTAADALRSHRNSPSRKGDSVRESSGKAPSVRELSVKAATVREPSMRDPSVRVPTVHDPSMRNPTIREPSVRAATIRERSVKAPTARDPSVRVPTIPNASVKSPSIYALSVNDAVIRELTERTESIGEPSLIDVKIHKTTVEDALNDDDAPRSIQTQTVSEHITEHITARLPPPRPMSRTPSQRPLSANIAAALLAQAREQDAEMRALQYFHEDEAQLGVAELATMVRALNAELADIAGAITESVPFGKTWKATQAWALDVAEPALEQPLKMLAGSPSSSRKGHNYAHDSTIVRLALQSWIVSKLESVFSHFLFGLEDNEDVFLKRLSKRVRSKESPAVAARWTRLTRRAARPSGFSSFLAHAAHVLEMDILAGLDSVLRFAGAYNAPPGELFKELSGTYGARVERVIRRAARLAEALAERAPPGYEVFTVKVGCHEGTGEHAKEGGGEREGVGGAFLCGCMESIERDVRRWVGAGVKKRGAGTDASVSRTARSRSRAARSRTARSRSRAPTVHSRTDTNIRTWDKDSDDEQALDDSDEDEEVEEDVDVYEEAVPGEGRHAEASVVCTLGFGLRRVLRARRSRRMGDTEAEAAAAVIAVGEDDVLELQHERRRGAEAEAGRAASKSSYSITTSASPSMSSRSSHKTRRTERPARDFEGPADTDYGAAESIRVSAKDGEYEKKKREKKEKGRWVDGEAEVVVKASVLMSTTLEMLQRHLIR